MLLIEPKWVQGVQQASTKEELATYLQNAIELEHATIPPYLTAYYTLKSDKNQEIGEIIESVVIQEMLHMTIAANTLVAIGGAPAIDTPDFIPAYPGKLPMCIGDGLVVPIKKFSREVVHDVFMAIEEPEDPLHFPVKAMAAEAAEPEYRTIGQFYEAVIAKVKELGDGIFIGDPERQVKMFMNTGLFPITDVDSAVKALQRIIVEGEGTSTSPIGDPGEHDLAHYYRFAEIYHGRKLVKDPNVPQGWSYSGEALPVDEDGVWNMEPNPKAANYPEGSRSRRLADQFNYTYTKVLKALHTSFNGEPDTIRDALALMFEIRLLAQQVLEQPTPDGKHQTGLTWEYAPVNV